MSSILEVEARFANTLYGYFLGKKVAFLIVKRYILNAWKKYGITRVMGAKNGFFFMYFSSSTRLEEVLENGLSNSKDTLVISIPKAVRNGVMLYTIKCPIKHAMADVRKPGGTSNDGFQTVQRKDFRGPLGSKKGMVGNYSLHKQHMPKSAYQKKTTSTPVSNAFFALEEDNGKPMDELVDDTRKNMELLPRRLPRRVVFGRVGKRTLLKEM
ncbi:hypothetical protein Tco_0835667 [Tanacetum coccineum]